MKKLTFTSIILLIMFGATISAQETEKFGNTLNLGLGIGYYGYAGHPMPVLHANYELNVVKNFTLAPFISFYTYSKDYYWEDKHNNYPYKYYKYRETVIPVGVKGTYYFDQLFQANAKWDFYAAGSLGFAIVNSSWDNDYYGDRDVYHGPSPLYVDLHVGAEYHPNSRIGFFLDLSSGVSTIGIAIH
ncbi:MAG: hypothetical protein CO118_11495 [Flavobacteriales bacterium CG_4_9_14_3_um_filter_32_8]|nr:MAG: hypothetical protein CO118_11495 [Flavobacteriales bacterium CG_4_9_14_3_um_filter_32_8]